MSLVGNWQREAARFTPKLRVHVHHGGGRHRGRGAGRRPYAGADLVLTTYGTGRARPGGARRDRVGPRGLRRGAGAQEQRHPPGPGRAQHSGARRRIALTGTPVENHLTELWSIMEFANPGLLGPAAGVPRAVRHARSRRTATRRPRRRCGRATGPFILRRLKTDKTIITDLPDKQEIKVWCNLTAEQASLYQATVDDMLDRIAEQRGHGAARPGPGHHGQAQAGLQPPRPPAQRRLAAARALGKAGAAGGDLRRGGRAGREGPGLHPVRRVRHDAAAAPGGPARPPGAVAARRHDQAAPRRAGPQVPGGRPSPRCSCCR